MPTLRAKDFDFGVPKVLAFKAPGESVTGQFGPQVKFVTTSGDWFYLDCEPAGDIERELQTQRIGFGEQFSLTRAKTSHGGSRFVIGRVGRGDSGGHNVPGGHNVVPRNGAGAEARSDRALEEELEKSVEMARDRKRAREESPEPAVPAITPASAKLCAALKAAIDASVEAATYAARLGVKLQFNEEDIRCMAMSVYINECKAGAR